MPGTRPVVVRAETPDVWSVMSVTTDAERVVCDTVPTRPFSSRTGIPSRRPSDEPLSIFTVAYQTVEDCAKTRAPTGP